MGSADGRCRTPDEIRRSIEANRAELGIAVERLRTEVAEVTDWRKQINKRRKQVLIGAAVAGFVLGGGIAAIAGLFTSDQPPAEPAEEVDTTGGDRRRIARSPPESSEIQPGFPSDSCGAWLGRWPVRSRRLIFGGLRRSAPPTFCGRGRR